MEFNKRVAPNKAVLEGKISLALISVQHVYQEHQSSYIQGRSKDLQMMGSIEERYLNFVTFQFHFGRFLLNITKCNGFQNPSLKIDGFHGTYSNIVSYIGQGQWVGE